MKTVATKLPKILIVDDEIAIRDNMKSFLEEFFSIKLAENGKESIEIAKNWRPELIIMDMMMPVMNGIAACKIIREQDYTRHIPIIMLTASNRTIDRKGAFNSGIDDFLSKPFDLDELKMRIDSRLGRTQDSLNVINDKISIGNLELNDRKSEITINGELVYFPPAEYGILKLLMNRVERSVSRKKIMKVVWGDSEKDHSVIDAHITALRKKLTNFSGDFQTVYGVGYRLKKEKIQVKNRLNTIISTKTTGNQCESGCLSFDGGEKRHDKHCVFYLESLSKIYDDQKMKIIELEDSIKAESKNNDLIRNKIFQSVITFLESDKTRLACQGPHNAEDYASWLEENKEEILKLKP